MLAACDNGSSNSSAEIDSKLYGTWVEVKGMAGPSERDTFFFSADSSFIDNNSTLPRHAEDGQIWEDFDTDRIYRYVYELKGDTLWMLEYEGDDDDSPKPMVRRWANAFVRIEKYVAPPAVDPSLVGFWIEAGDDSYRDSIKILTTQFEFHPARADLFQPRIYGADGSVFVSEGVIGHTVDGVRMEEYTYRAVADTLYFDACGGRCSEIRFDFTPGQVYVRIP